MREQRTVNKRKQLYYLWRGNITHLFFKLKETGTERK